MGSEDPQLPVTSSTEPDWPPEARACYRDALQTLLDGGISFVVGGAFAVHTHTGIWRTTKDLDLLITVGELPKALDRLQEKGFQTYVKDPVWLAKAWCGEYFVDLITGIGNASLGVDDDLDRARGAASRAGTALPRTGRRGTDRHRRSSLPIASASTEPTWCT